MGKSHKTTTRAKLRNPSTLPGSFSSRVFVGGSYKVAAAAAGIAPRQLLSELRKVVIDRGLHPIIADEYAVDDPETNIHRDAIFLLGGCQLAIFELSEMSGALMEIERSADWKIQCMILHHDPTGRGLRLSRMLSSFVKQHHERMELYGYLSIAEACNASRNWLDKMLRLGHARR